VQTLAQPQDRVPAAPQSLYGEAYERAGLGIFFGNAKGEQLEISWVKGVWARVKPHLEHLIEAGQMRAELQTAKMFVSTEYSVPLPLSSSSSVHTRQHPRLNIQTQILKGFKY
jgi:hypothetical protein